MKYLNVFDDKSVLDSSVASIKHRDGAFVFGVKTAQGIEYVTIYDQRHPGANCVRLGSVNMEPVILDSSSTKETLEVGDFLYSTADGRLTLDAQTDGATNTAIAICVIPFVYENFENGDDYENGFITARFVSLNYMNYNTPTTGNKVPQTMQFGNYGAIIGNVKGDIDEAPETPKTPYRGTSYIGGKWNTQQCLSKATNQDVICDGVTNNSGIGYCAPACCCVAYSTPGTKPGDWYLPMPGELNQIYENKIVINEKRTAIKGEDFLDGSYWSSRENSRGDEFFVGLNDDDHLSVDISVSLKDSNFYVLAFIAVGPPEQPGQPGRPGQPEEG